MKRRMTVVGIALIVFLTACLPSQENSTTGSGGAASLDTEELVFLDLINQYREQNGISPLMLSSVLDQSASWMSTDMASNNYLNHTDSSGRDPFARMQAFGYNCFSAAGENIAAGYADAQSTFNQWKSDAAHNQNMLSPDYAAIGIARASNPSSAYRWYWTTDFGGCSD